MEGDLGCGSAFFSAEIDHLVVEWCFRPAKVLNKRNDPSLIEEVVAFLHLSFVNNGNVETWVEEGKFAQPT